MLLSATICFAALCFLLSFSCRLLESAAGIYKFLLSLRHLAICCCMVRFAIVSQLSAAFCCFFAAICSYLCLVAASSCYLLLFAAVVCYRYLMFAFVCCFLLLMDLRSKMVPKWLPEPPTWPLKENKGTDQQGLICTLVFP